MISHTNKKIIGILAISISLISWVIDKMTQYISRTLGQMIYGDRYMQSSNAMIGDSSYEFNIDMHLTFVLTIIFIFGLLLYISSHKEIE